VVHMNNMQNPLNTKGAALLLFITFFLATSLSFVLTIVQGVYDDLAQYKVLEAGKKSFYAAEAGIEDAVYRHIQGLNYSSTESFDLSGITVDMTRVTSGSSRIVTATGDSTYAVRRSNVELVIGGGVTFGFGIQSGNGGFTLANSARVYGNVFSNGSITGAGNDIYGDVISAGSSGLVDNIHATGSVWAHTITSATVDKDAYYQSISGSLVYGSNCTSNVHCHPGSTDQATSAMPISDDLIDAWKTTAEAAGTVSLASCSGGTSAGTYTLSSDQNFGPRKVPCNLSITGNNTDIYVGGPIWVVGNISTANGPAIRASSSLASTSVAIIADNPSNSTTSSKISIQGTTGYVGAAGDSYILMVSMNTSASEGGSEVAIDVDNNTPSSEREVIYYAPYGELVGRNSLLLRGATAHQISLSNSASVYYETGMLDPLFTGSGGGYNVGDWQEI
jgi:hypothetical protein